MNFWELMIKKDDIILSFIEGIRKLIYATDRQIQKARKEMAKRPIEGIGKELYLLLNAPSLKTQDISVLKGKNTMFVNRGFMHPLYKELHPLFKNYQNNKQIYWLTYSLPFYNLGVSGSCFSFAIQQKFKKIYFTGFDATGIGHEMIKTADSHFYGNDKELENKTTSQFVIDLLMHSRHLHDLNRLAAWSEKKSYKLINITNGGLLDMFPREDILPLLTK